MRFVTANKCFKLAMFVGFIGAILIIHNPDPMPATDSQSPESKPIPVIRKLKIGADSEDTTLHDERKVCF